MEKQLIDILWVIASASLVFFMQGGFLCLETGLTRSKNNINVALKNLTDLGVSIVMFWAFGYALMYGVSAGGWIGVTEFMPDLSERTPWFSVFLLFQVMFCGTAVTILSGAVAERMTFIGYVLVAVLVSGLIYPVFGHWAWNGINANVAGGWLSAIGFVDFA
ncbi:MAG: ammonium transporter, partial [Chloroflexota bacterium]